MAETGEDTLSCLRAALDAWASAAQDSHGMPLPAASDAGEPGDRVAALERALAESTARIQELTLALDAARAAADGLRFEIARRTAADAAATASRASAAASAPIAAETPSREANQDARAAAFDAEGHKRRLGDILVAQGVLTPAQLAEALDAQQRDPHRRLGAIVVERGLTSEDVIAKILAAQLRLPYVELNYDSLDRATAAVITPHMAGLHRCVPLRRESGRLVLAMANPLDLIAIEDVELAANCRVEPVVAAPRAIDAVIAWYYPDA